MRLGPEVVAGQTKGVRSLKKSVKETGSGRVCPLQLKLRTSWGGTSLCRPQHAKNNLACFLIKNAKNI